MVEKKRDRRDPVQVWKETKRRLRLAKVKDAEWESRAMLEHVLGLQPGEPIPEGNLSKEQWIAMEKLVRHRCNREPLQYLLGTWEFYGLPLKVGPGVLIPRQDTETLVDAVLKLRKKAESTQLLDLCSGSGCIAAAISQHLPNVTGDSLELSEDALSYQRQNLAQHAPQIQIHQGDALHLQKQLEDKRYDIITCNPPYLTEADMNLMQPELQFEPRMALYGGKDGLLFYRYVTQAWKSCLKEKGWLVYEVGIGQAVQVERILRENDFCNCRIIPDLTGINRVVMGRRRVEARDKRQELGKG